VVDAFKSLTTKESGAAYGRGRPYLHNHHCELSTDN
jgi:hypothetical protein